MTTATLTLTDFLLARIAEDEVYAVTHREVLPADDEGFYHRVLAECEAKRRIVDRHGIRVDPCDAHNGYTMQSEDCFTLRALAAIYSNHADYRSEWAA